MFHILGRIYVPGTVSLDHRVIYFYAVHTENTKSENIQPNGIEYKISMRKENLVLSFFYHIYTYHYVSNEFKIRYTCTSKYDIFNIIYIQNICIHVTACTQWFQKKKKRHIAIYKFSPHLSTSKGQSSV